MAQPISTVKEVEEEKIEEIEPFADRMETSLASIVKFTDAMNSSGLLPMLTSLIEHYDDTLKIIVEQISTEKTSQFINNLLTIYTLLSSIDQRRLLSIINSVSETINSVEKFRSQETLGLLSMLRMLRNPDVSAGLRATLEILGGLSRKEE